MVEDGDVVRIDYIGRKLPTGEIFDLTSEEIAEEEGYDVDDMELGPMNVLIGASHVIPGLEDALRDMEEGESKEFEVAAEDAFGERDSDQVKTIPESDFDEHEVRPQRGLVVEVDGRRGKIISTSSGRVRVDFNHPLAGKNLEYELEVLEVLDDPTGRVEAVMEFYGLNDSEDVSYTFNDEDGELELGLPDEFNNPELADQLVDELELIKGVDAVTIT